MTDLKASSDKIELPNVKLATYPALVDRVPSFSLRESFTLGKSGRTGLFFSPRTHVGPSSTQVSIIKRQQGFSAYRSGTRGGTEEEEDASGEPGSDMARQMSGCELGESFSEVKPAGLTGALQGRAVLEMVRSMSLIKYQALQNAFEATDTGTMNIREVLGCWFSLVELKGYILCRPV
jgi:hypothetical protein